MSATETAMSALGRNWSMVGRALEDVDDVILRSQPNNQSNSMGWLLWHMIRIVDHFVHPGCQGSLQLWIKDNWYNNFGLDDDINNTGMSWNEEQVIAWDLPAKNLLVDYYEAVNAAAREYIQPLSAVDLDRQIPAARPPDTVSIGSRLGVVVYDNYVHGGQIASLRGYYKGMGWFV